MDYREGMDRAQFADQATAMTKPGLASFRLSVSGWIFSGPLIDNTTRKGVLLLSVLLYKGEFYEGKVWA